jgi:hypothetical protein
MTYNKPSVTVVGVAAEVIQRPLKHTPNGADLFNGVLYREIPAYDLDE